MAIKLPHRSSSVSPSIRAVGDLVQVVNSISDGDVNALVDEYESCYTMTPATQIHGKKRQNVLEAARIELGMKRFLEQGGFHAFTTTFEDLHGLKQLLVWPYSV